jgi:hypothetical protein
VASVFAPYRDLAYPYRFATTLLVDTLVGGCPTDPNVAEGWLKSKLTDKDSLIQEMVAEVMLERTAAGTPVTKEEAAQIVDTRKHLNGFRRQRCENCGPKGLCDGQHQLFIEGRHVKAAIKEAASIAMATERLKAKGWGATRKSLLGFVAEHIFVLEDRLPLFTKDGQPVTEPTGVNQQFVSTFRGSGIKNEEFATEVTVKFTVTSDYDFDSDDWGQLWVTGEQNGLGASRSQGYGRYEVIQWDPIAVPKPKFPKKAATMPQLEPATAPKPGPRPKKVVAA